MLPSQALVAGAGAWDGAPVCHRLSVPPEQNGRGSHPVGRGMTIPPAFARTPLFGHRLDQKPGLFLWLTERSVNKRALTLLVCGSYNRHAWLRKTQFCR